MFTVNMGLEDCVFVCFMLFKFKFIFITPVECIVNVQLHIYARWPPRMLGWEMLQQELWHVFNSFVVIYY